MRRFALQGEGVIDMRGVFTVPGRKETVYDLSSVMPRKFKSR